MDQQTENKLISDVGEIKGTVKGMANTVLEHVRKEADDKRELWSAMERTRERMSKAEAGVDYLKKDVLDNEKDIRAVAGKSGGRLGAWAGTGMAGLVIAVVEYLKSVFGNR